MNRSGAWWGATIGAVAAYTAAALLPGLPDLSYYPTEHTWTIARVLDAPAIHWYGWLAYAVAGALVGSIGGRALLRFRAAWHIVWITCASALLLLITHEARWFR